MTDAAPTAKTLGIAVIGLGGIGSAFAFHLARDGHHNVTAVARPGSKRLGQLQRDGGVVKVGGNHVGMTVTDTLDADTPYDLVIVSLLSHQIGAILPALVASRAKSIQFMFNTFEPERLAQAVGAERCAFGMPFIQATVDEDGRLNAVIGAGGQKSIMNEQRWVDVFVAAGLPARPEPDMRLWLRCHAPMCVAIESVSAAAVRRGGAASWGEALVIARGVHECFRLIWQMGYRLYPWEKSCLGASPAWLIAGFLWVISRIATVRDLLATGVSECHALIEVMAAAARAHPSIVVARIEAMKPLGGPEGSPARA